MIALIVWSCAKTGPNKPQPENKPPAIQIVNIPPNHSHFTTNPQIYWFGTDADGYIIGYEYAVVPLALLPSDVDTTNSAQVLAYANSNIHSPVAGRNCVQESCWQFIDITNGASPGRQTIRLFADKDPLINTSELFFVRAVDNDSLRSGIDFRIYSRNNHPPNTLIKTLPDTVDAGYYDHKDTAGTFKGIALEWKGTDKVDYQSDVFEPEFDYFYELYGPFEYGEIPWISPGRIDSMLTDASFDTTALRASHKLVLTSVDTATGGVWVKKTTTKVFDLWRNVGDSDTTRDAYFVLKVTARDDAFVSDLTPAYFALHAIDPHFQKKMMVYVDLNIKLNCDKPGGVRCERVESMLKFYKDVFSGYISDPEQDFRVGTVIPPKTVIGKYEVFVVISDGEKPTTLTDSFYIELSKYMSLGGNAWIWAINPFGNLYSGTSVGLRTLPPYGTKEDYYRIPGRFFGVLSEYRADWTKSYTNRYNCDEMPCPLRNEAFIGASYLPLPQTAGEGFRDFDVDMKRADSYWYKTTDTLQYLKRCVAYDTAGNCTKWEYDTLTYEQRVVHWVGTPSTNYFVPDVFTTPLLLFKSYYGDILPDSLKEYIPMVSGKDVAVRFDTGRFKSAVFGFSLNMMYQEDAVDLITSMMNWFLKK